MADVEKVSFDGIGVAEGGADELFEPEGRYGRFVLRNGTDR